MLRKLSRLAEKGGTFIASPVFGASPVAAAGKLIFAMAGPAKIVERLRPFILDVMGRRIIYMGEEVHKSSLLKISGYFSYFVPVRGSIQKLTVPGTSLSLVSKS